MNYAYYAVALLNVALATHDGWFTSRRIRIFGPEIELNKTVTACLRWVGVPGIYFATIAPTLAFTWMALYFNLPLILGTVLGARLCLFDFQQTSKELEIAILGQLKAHKARPPST